MVATVTLVGFYENLLQQAGGRWFDFEGLIRDVYVALLRPGDVVVDAGANRGDHTFQMAQAIAPDGRVIAIEAVPELAEHLLRTLRSSYPHLAGVVDVRGIGLSDRHRTAPFYYAPEQSGLSGLRNREVLAQYHVQEIEVRLAPLDFICRDLPGRLRYAKIDVEGAEFEALRGGVQTLRRHRPAVVFEHDRDSPRHFGYGVEDLLALFHGLAYRIYDLFGNSYDRPEPWADTLVWNFVALPDERDTEVVFGTVRRTLASLGFRLPNSTSVAPEGPRRSHR